jgi:hypothetical protein
MNRTNIEVLVEGSALGQVSFEQVHTAGFCEYVNEAPGPGGLRKLKEIRNFLLSSWCCFSHLKSRSPYATGSSARVPVYLESTCCEKFPKVWRNQKVHYRITDSPPIVPNLRQMHPITSFYCTSLRPLLLISPSYLL